MVQYVSSSSLLLAAVLLMVLQPYWATAVTYNVVNLGAKGDGHTDSTKAFLNAWAAACGSASPATIYVPPGRYLLLNAVFPFQDVTGVSIIGGVLDGQGTGLWACKRSGKSCPSGATTLGLTKSNNILIRGLTSLNSQMFHIVINGCHVVKLQGVRVSASGHSPNTDGIHVQLSSGVTILDTQIKTGDDCVSVGPGATNLWIENVACGPGHGISIGSLGKDLKEEGVQNVTVKTVTFTGSQNGVRIKSWARASNGFVKRVVFQHILMVNVQNPIVIDQNYCPGHKNCPGQVSGVKVSDVTYQDIHGTSASEVAMKFDCSSKIHAEQSPESSCVNAGVVVDGISTSAATMPTKQALSIIGSAIIQHNGNGNGNGKGPPMLGQVLQLISVDLTWRHRWGHPLALWAAASLPLPPHETLYKLPSAAVVINIVKSGIGVKGGWDWDPFHFMHMPGFTWNNVFWLLLNVAAFSFISIQVHIRLRAVRELSIPFTASLMGSLIFPRHSFGICILSSSSHFLVLLDCQYYGWLRGIASAAPIYREVGQVDEWHPQEEQQNIEDGSLEAIGADEQV
ncbi:hypothetical protein AAG906_033727 [Vitis piasezkii]